MWDCVLMTTINSEEVRCIGGTIQAQLVAVPPFFCNVVFLKVFVDQL